MWWELLYARKPFWNISYVEKFSYLKCFHRLSLYRSIAATFFLPTNVRFLTQYLSIIAQNQLRHRLSQAAWIYFASYEYPTLEKKHACIGTGEGSSTSINDQLLWIRKRLHYVNHSRSVFCSRNFNGLNQDSHLFFLYTRCYCESLGMTNFSLCNNRVRRFHLSTRVTVDLFNSIQDRSSLARNEWMVAQSLYGLDFWSLGSLDNDQELWYGTTAFAPLQTLRPPLSQLLRVRPSLHPSPPSPRTPVLSAMSKNGDENKTRVHGHQSVSTFPPGHRSRLCYSAQTHCGLCHQNRSDVAHYKNGRAVENSFSQLVFLQPHPHRGFQGRKIRRDMHKNRVNHLTSHLRRSLRLFQ